MRAKPAPNEMYAELFQSVQSNHLFADSKTFVDATALSAPRGILRKFRAERDRPEFDLATFVNTHFVLPSPHDDAPSDPKDSPVEKRIDQLWDVLTRAADKNVEYSSLIPLPNPYVVPGGRFREVYYWDSYFTMLGLADSGRIDLINDMVQNFAYLIDEIGFVPNGNRTYYCTRSQPPYFALMVELLADVSNDDSVMARFRPQLEREYEFWISGADRLCAERPAHRRVVAADDGYVNRFWDDSAIPRQESYAEDVELAADFQSEPGGALQGCKGCGRIGMGLYFALAGRWAVDGYDSSNPGHPCGSQFANVQARVNACENLRDRR